MPPALPVLGSAAQPAYGALPPAADGAVVPAVYVHVPFCNSKCHYCDFYSVAGHLQEAGDYLRALAREIGLQTRHFGKPAPETVFIGGGTPTLLAPRDLGRLLELVRGGMDGSRVVEFTVEGNPNTFDPERARVLAAHGVNRMSFGAQSFIERELRVLQRDHDPANVAPAMDWAREAGIENLNIDLIFGTPGQTLADWDYSLRQAIALAPTHLSCYSLIYEPNTAMTARMKAGEFAPLEEEQELRIFQHTYDMLRAAGYRRYEVSNYARVEAGRDYACRHNLHYWKGSNYLAWGPSAAAGYQGWHWKNVQNLRHYLAALLGDEPVVPVTQREHLSAVRRAGESVMLWLRLTEGIDYTEFAQQTGVDARPRLARVRAKYAGMGLLEADERRIRLTEAGVPVSDAIIADALRDFA